MPIESTNLDANETIFFERELESVKSQTYDIRYAMLKATQLIPVSSDAGAGAETITYQQFDQVGMAKVIADYADDLPRCDIKGKEFRSPVRSIGASYGYSIQEIRAASMVGRPLDSRKASATRRANDQKVNNIAWFGDATNGLPGLLNNPNIPSSAAPNGAGGFPQWSTKTPQEILADMNALANSIITLTKGVENPNTLLLPLAQFTLISTTNAGNNTDTTILEYFLRNTPTITNVEWVNELAGAGPGGVDLMVAYDRNPDKLTLEIPQAYEQFAPQQQNLEFNIPVHSRCGGVLVYYPLSLAFMEDI